MRKEGGAPCGNAVVCSRILPNHRVTTRCSLSLCRSRGDGGVSLRIPNRLKNEEGGLGGVGGRFGSEKFLQMIGVDARKFAAGFDFDVYGLGGWK